MTLSRRPLSAGLFRVVPGLSLALLIACGGGGSKTAATQVAAKVNDTEITVHQINFLLQRQPGLKAEQAQEAGKKALDYLINEQLAVQKAKDMKLDRNPGVAQALEAAQREVLARAYAEQVGAKQPKPTADEVAKYYTDNPVLFKDRKIYSITELAVKVDADQVQTVRDAVKAASDLNDLAQRFRAKNIAFGAQPTTLPAEAIPAPVLAQLASAPIGQARLTEGPRGLQIMVVNATRPAPVDEATAKPAIERLLLAERGRKAVDLSLAEMRKSAKIEYVGSFAPGAAPASATAASPLAASSPAAPDPIKGISGLK